MKLKESNYPVDKTGKPDLRFYKDPLDHYIDLYDRYLAVLAGKNPGESAIAFQLRVHGIWGMIAKGRAAIPKALELLKNSEPEARAGGAAILAEIGKSREVVGSVVEILQQETDLEAKDTLIQALGRMKARHSIPALAEIIRNEVEDGDTRLTAVESLGLVVRKNFLKKTDPETEATKWLERNGY